MLSAKGSEKVQGLAAEGVSQFERLRAVMPAILKDDGVALAGRKVAVGVLYSGPQKGLEQLDQHVSMGLRLAQFGRATP